MTLEKDDAKAGNVRGIFARISTDYNRMNRIMTFGMDISWRRFLLSVADVPEGGRLLDVGTGTGDIALEALRMDPTMHVTGIDFTSEMMDTGRGRKGAERIEWGLADALRLPFPDGKFDAVVSGFLLRNVVDIKSALMEQTRVVKPGGCVACLDTSPVARNALRPVIRFYLRTVIPFLGRLITGKGDAYRYLADSTMNFIEPEGLAGLMSDAGLANVTFRRFMFGNIAVHWGIRPDPSKGGRSLAAYSLGGKGK